MKKSGSNGEGGREVPVHASVTVSVKLWPRQATPRVDLCQEGLVCRLGLGRRDLGLLVVLLGPVHGALPQCGEVEVMKDHPRRRRVSSSYQSCYSLTTRPSRWSKEKPL